MKAIKQHLWLTMAAIAFAGFAAVAETAVIWTEDFSDVSDWQVISDPGGGSTITSEASLGVLFVQASNSLGAFGPKPGIARLVAFDPGKKSNCFMAFSVSNLTGSVSYDIALDEFDANTNYVDTVWQVFPAASTSTFVGSTNVSLGVFSYSTNAVYLLPKVTVHTGDGSQTVRFRKIEFAVSSMRPRLSP